MVNIVSPGGLPNGLTEADLLQGRSEIRNRVLARVFRELGYIEHWGSGLQRIKQICEAEHLATPEFLETGDFFDVKLYRPVIEPLGGSIGGSIEDLGGSMLDAEILTDRQNEILVLIQQNPKISYRDMAVQLGINDSAVKKHLNHLRNAGWLERVGGTRGYWLVKKKS